MNKILLFAAAVAAVSCSTVGEDNIINKGGSRVVSVGVGSDGDVQRVAINDDWVLTWEEDDQLLAVEATGATSCFEIDSYDAENSTFTGEVAGDQFRLFYPYNAGATIKSGGLYNVNISNQEAGATSSLNMISETLIGAGDATVMKHVGATAVLDLLFDDYYEGWTVESAVVSGMYNSVDLDTAKGVDDMGFYWNMTEGNITISANETIPADGAVKLRFNILPCNFGVGGTVGVEVTLKDSVGATVTLTTVIENDTDDAIYFARATYNTLYAPEFTAPAPLSVATMTALDPADPAGVTVDDPAKSAIMAKAYLNGEVKFTGTGLSRATAVKIGEEFATIISKSDEEMIVKISDGYDFGLGKGAAEGGKKIEIFENNQTKVSKLLDETAFLFKVFPFYHYKDITLNGRSSDIGTVFFNLESGEYVAIDDFPTLEPDVSQGQKSTDYNSVDPYIWYNPTSSVASFYSPANGKSTLDNVRNSDGDSVNTGIELAGTPAVKYKALYLEDSKQSALSDLIVTRAFTAQQTSIKGATSSPGMGNDKPVLETVDSKGKAKTAYFLSTYKEGAAYNEGASVVSYFRDLDGDGAADDIYKNGYMVLTSTTCFNEGGVGEVYTDSSHTQSVTFDIYWPKYDVNYTGE